METDRVLLIPGDGDERECMEYAAELLNLMAPAVEIERAEFGRAAMEEYNDILPIQTEDAVADARIILCGRADMTGFNKKNPLKTIIEHNNITMRAVEFYSLPYMCPRGRKMEGCIVTPILLSHQIREADSLNEIETTYVTVDEDEETLFKLCAKLAVKRGRGTVVHLTSKEVLPLSSSLSDRRFRKIMEAHNLEPVCYDTIHGFSYFSAKAENAGMIVGGPFATLPLLGAAYGMTGGLGLMSDTLVGENLSIYTLPANTPEERRSNPTAAFMAVANLLNDIGYTLESRQVINGLNEIYHSRLITSDVHGSRTTRETFTALVEAINTYQEKTS